ncbi:hypothetical protein HID58_030200 [Brassica napus]|uniref:MRG domain-containing protein n=1 Tax=Brassica napus TaxID=3708 RepID=A0ABQ8CFA4_BRANA|nr:hypothetical protein HID58_030200 [Brassica napus]
MLVGSVLVETRPLDLTKTGEKKLVAGFFDGLSLGSIKGSGPSPGKGHNFVDRSDTFQFDKHSGPSPSGPVPENGKLVEGRGGDTTSGGTSPSNDGRFFSKSERIVKLPRSPNVDEILSKYLELTQNQEGWNVNPAFNQRVITDSVGEILKGIRCYFNKALPVMLLYKKEQPQYQETNDISPSAVYGADHLLRLFGKNLSSFKRTRAVSCNHQHMIMRRFQMVKAKTKTSEKEMPSS